jgi:hypothetical protein
MSGIMLNIISAAMGGSSPVGVLASIRSTRNTIGIPRSFIKNDQLVLSVRTLNATSENEYTVAKLPLDLATFTWQNGLSSGSNSPQIYDVTIDSADNVIVAGEIFINGLFNPGVPYLAKYNSSGVFQWNRYINQRGRWDVVTTDASNNIYPNGTGRWASTSKDDVIYAKYPPGGATVTFQRTMTTNDGTNAQGFGYGVTILNDTQYVMGVSVGSVPSGPPFIPNLDYQAVLGVFDQTTGNLVSALQYGSTANIWQLGGYTIRGEAADTIYEVFTTYVTNSSSKGSMVLVKYTTAGGTVWQREFADFSITLTGQVTCMDASNTHIYAVAGTFSEAPATGRNELQITKWDTSGNLVWQRSVVSPTNSLTQPKISVDSLDNFYLSFFSSPVPNGDRAVILKMPGSGAGSGNTATVDGIKYDYLTTSRVASTSTLPVASFTRPQNTTTLDSVANTTTIATGSLATTTGPF